MGFIDGVKRALGGGTDDLQIDYGQPTKNSVVVREAKDLTTGRTCSFNIVKDESGSIQVVNGKGDTGCLRKAKSFVGEQIDLVDAGGR